MESSQEAPDTFFKVHTQTMLTFITIVEIKKDQKVFLTVKLEGNQDLKLTVFFFLNVEAVKWEQLILHSSQNFPNLPHPQDGGCSNTIKQVWGNPTKHSAKLKVSMKVILGFFMVVFLCVLMTQEDWPGTNSLAYFLFLN